MTSDEVLAGVQAIGESVAQLLVITGLAEYVDGFAIQINAEKLQDMLVNEEGARGVDEVTEFLAGL